MQFLAFNLTEACRLNVLGRQKPKFEEIYCHHVTHIYGIGPDSGLPLPAKPASMLAYGYACDDSGVELLMIDVDGGKLRPDGKPYHLTLSLASGRRQAESNDVIEKFGWQPLPQPIAIDAEPTWND